MARPNDYPRWRYLTMQGVMWVILVASLGLAAATSRARANYKAALGDPITLQTLSVRLPEKWKIFKRGDDEVVAVELAREPRTIYVTERDPDQFNFIEWFAGGRPRQQDRGEPITVGPSTGNLTITHESVHGVYLQTTAILSSGIEVEITLQSFEPDPQDITLLKQVAATVKPLEERGERGPQLRRR